MFRGDCAVWGPNPRQEGRMAEWKGWGTTGAPFSSLATGPLSRGKPRNLRCAISHRYKTRRSYKMEDSSDFLTQRCLLNTISEIIQMLQS